MRNDECGMKDSVPFIPHSSFRIHHFLYWSPVPFLPFFFVGSTSRGRMAGAGGGGASSCVVTCGGAGSVFFVPDSAGVVAVSPWPGGGGSVTCSSFGSVTVAGVVVLSASASPFAAAAIK